MVQNSNTVDSGPQAHPKGCQPLDPQWFRFLLFQPLGQQNLG
jgi:hypothetical protein